MASNLGAEPEEVVENLQVEGLKAIDELYPIMSQNISDKICEFVKKSGMQYENLKGDFIVRDGISPSGKYEQEVVL